MGSMNFEEKARRRVSFPHFAYFLDDSKGEVLFH